MKRVLFSVYLILFGALGFAQTVEEVQDFLIEQVQGELDMVDNCTMGTAGKGSFFIRSWIQIQNDSAIGQKIIDEVEFLANRYIVQYGAERIKFIDVFLDDNFHGLHMLVPAPDLGIPLESVAESDSELTTTINYMPFEINGLGQVIANQIVLIPATLEVDTYPNNQFKIKITIRAQYYFDCE